MAARAHLPSTRTRPSFSWRRASPRKLPCSRQRKVEGRSAANSASADSNSLSGRAARSQAFSPAQRSPRSKQASTMCARVAGYSSRAAGRPSLRSTPPLGLRPVDRDVMCRCFMVLPFPFGRVERRPMTGEWLSAVGTRVVAGVENAKAAALSSPETACLPSRRARPPLAYRAGRARGQVTTVSWRGVAFGRSGPMAGTPALRVSSRFAVHNMASAQLGVVRSATSVSPPGISGSTAGNCINPLATLRTRR